MADDSVGRVEVGPESNPDQLALREAIFARLETPRFLEQAEALPPTGRNLGNATAALGTLVSPAQATALLATATRDRIAAHRLDTLVGATQSVDAETRTSLFGTLSSEGLRSTAARVIENVASSSAWKRLTVSQKTDLSRVMAAADEPGLKHLGALVEANPGALLGQDSAGGTLLGNLAQLAGQPLNAALYRHADRESVLEGVLRDVVNPNRIDQGTTTTCTVTSMQYELVKDDPAEYVRLLAGLTGPEGKATMAGGGVLRLGADDVLSQARHERSISCSVFQGAAMEYANGADDFDAVSGRSTRENGTKVYAGLQPYQQTTILRQLFGVRYQTDTLFTEAEGAKALAQLKGYEASAHENRPVILDIDQGQVNHAVTLDGFRDGRVYFRDPYGELRSMPDAAFAKAVVAIHKPIDS